MYCPRDLLVCCRSTSVRSPQRAGTLRAKNREERNDDRLHGEPLSTRAELPTEPSPPSASGRIGTCYPGLECLLPTGCHVARWVLTRRRQISVGPCFSSLRFG